MAAAVYPGRGAAADDRLVQNLSGIISMKLPMCRSCGEYGLAMILSLGRMPLANALLTAEQLTEPEPTYPLDLAFCTRCALVQVTETVPPEQLFREYYYFSSFS